MRKTFNTLLQLPMIAVFIWACFKFDYSHDYYYAAWAGISMLELIWLECGTKGEK